MVAVHPPATTISSELSMPAHGSGHVSLKLNMLKNALGVAINGPAANVPKELFRFSQVVRKVPAAEMPPHTNVYGVEPSVNALDMLWPLRFVAKLPVRVQLGSTSTGCTSPVESHVIVTSHVELAGGITARSHGLAALVS